MNNDELQGHRKLIVWQKSMDLVVALYKLTEDFPRSEQYGLTSQMRRSAVSIPSNIAEGNRRGGKNDYRHFLVIAFGSAAELETQLELSERLVYGSNERRKETFSILNEVIRMLNKMTQVM